jgi:hypothetical protein
MESEIQIHTMFIWTVKKGPRWCCICTSAHKKQSLSPTAICQVGTQSRHWQCWTRLVAMQPWDKGHTHMHVNTQTYTCVHTHRD